jgi:hypothetical protein
MPLITREQAKKSGMPRKTLQTILISKTLSIPQSKAWLKEHGYASSYWRQTKDFRRWMQSPPIDGATYSTSTLPNGIELVYQRY